MNVGGEEPSISQTSLVCVSLQNQDILPEKLKLQAAKVHAESVDTASTQMEYETSEKRSSSTITVTLVSIVPHFIRQLGFNTETPNALAISKETNDDETLQTAIRQLGCDSRYLVCEEVSGGWCRLWWCGGLAAKESSSFCIRPEPISILALSVACCAKVEIFFETCYRIILSGINADWQPIDIYRSKLSGSLISRIDGYFGNNFNDEGLHILS